MRPASHTAHRSLNPSPNIGRPGSPACLMACSLRLPGIPILIGANVAYFTPLGLLVLSVKICGLLASTTMSTKNPRWVSN